MTKRTTSSSVAGNVSARPGGSTQTSAAIRTPVVTILGHVDHGKTTLLDTIRKTNVAGRETGGITQHIGAYQISVSTKGNLQPRKITFIDTPGHEAFAKMRARGAKVADIAVLVVSANDGVMPQTKEAIQHIQQAGIKCVVAITKVDLPDTNLEKIKKQLSRERIKLEEYGGDVPVVAVSAKKGLGIEKLLEMILLVSDLFTNEAKEPKNFKGVVIESSLSKNKGALATLITRSGRLRVGDEIICDRQVIRVRQLLDWQGKVLKEMTAGDAAEVLGWKIPPLVGSQVTRKDQSEINPVEKPLNSDSHVNNGLTQERIAANSSTLVVPPILTPSDKLTVIIKSDTAGTLEAISMQLTEMVNILSAGAGLVSESDVFLAKSASAIIINFNQKIPDSVSRLATAEKVLIKSYNIVYELFDEIDEVVEALKRGDLVTTLGTAKVLALFPYNDETVIGVKVASGRIARGDQVKVMRDEVEVGRARIKSLRHRKDDITKAEQGHEAGIILSQKLEVLTGDSIISIG